MKIKKVMGLFVLVAGTLLVGESLGLGKKKPSPEDTLTNEITSCMQKPEASSCSRCCTNSKLIGAYDKKNKSKAGLNKCNQSCETKQSTIHFKS